MSDVEKDEKHPAWLDDENDEMYVGRGWLLLFLNVFNQKTV